MKVGDVVYYFKFPHESVIFYIVKIIDISREEGEGPVAVKFLKKIYDSRETAEDFIGLEFWVPTENIEKPEDFINKMGHLLFHWIFTKVLEKR